MSKRKTLQIGDVVRHQKYGMGRIHQIDPNDREFFFDIHFDIDAATEPLSGWIRFAPCASASWFIGRRRHPPLCGWIMALSESS